MGLFCTWHFPWYPFVFPCAASKSDTFLYCWGIEKAVQRLFVSKYYIRRGKKTTPYHSFRNQHTSSSLGSLARAKTLVPLCSVAQINTSWFWMGIEHLLHHPLFLEVSFCRCFLFARIMCSDFPPPPPYYRVSFSVIRYLLWILLSSSGDPGISELSFQG